MHSIVHVGDVQGIDTGALVSTTINGRFEFDMLEKCITLVEWTQKDERQQCPISPAMKADVTIKLKRMPVQVPEELSPIGTDPRIPRDKTPPSYLTNVHHRDAKGRFTLEYPRAWHRTSSDDRPELVLRLMDREGFIGQVTILPTNRVDPSKVMSLDKFADEMRNTIGWEEEKEESREEFKDQQRARGHHKIYRVVASGELDRVKTWQCFYLVVSPQGEQVIITFSIVPQQAPRLGARDLELVRDLMFPDSSK